MHKAIEGVIKRNVVRLANGEIFAVDLGLFLVAPTADERAQLEPKKDKDLRKKFQEDMPF